MLYLITIILLILIILLTIRNFEFFQNQITPSEEIYLFWTGGYDSTFRLCQALIDENKTVTPIYISYKHLDNHPHKNFKRKSHAQELYAMNKIKKILINRYPHIKPRFKKIINIPYVKIQKNILQCMENLWKEGRNHRSLSQYGGLAQVSLDLNKNIEIAVEKSRHSTMRNMVKKYVVKFPNGKYKLKNPDKNTTIFRNMVFPTFYLSKKEMLNIAKNNGYDDILKYTWSCWFPKNGKPCGKCPMCRQRII